MEGGSTDFSAMVFSLFSEFPPPTKTIRSVRSAAALDLRERAEELGFSVSVGVNTGRVYFGPVGSALHEELTVMGPTVNLAARLQAAAGTGQVVVGDGPEPIPALPSN